MGIDFCGPHRRMPELPLNQTKIVLTGLEKKAGIGVPTTMNSNAFTSMNACFGQDPSECVLERALVQMVPSEAEQRSIKCCCLAILLFPSQEALCLLSELIPNMNYPALVAFAVANKHCAVPRL